MDPFMEHDCTFEEGRTPSGNFGNLNVYEIPESEVPGVCVTLHRDCGLPIKTITAMDTGAAVHRFRILYVFGVPRQNRFIVLSADTRDNGTFPSITPSIHEASVYERKIMTFFGLRPEHHPHPRRTVLHENWPENLFPLRRDVPWNTRPGNASVPYRFNEVEGEGIYEIPVGPVHAGIIEPGHFRFSVAGEEIIMLEPRLGYTHKGTEKLFEVPAAGDEIGEKVRLSERVSGDTSYSHSLAFCQAVESLADLELPGRAAYLRVIYSELERLANHIGDIGALMTDAGFGFGGSSGSRLREVVMQWNNRLTSSRFLRGVNTPGGVTRDMTPGLEASFLKFLGDLRLDFSEVIEVAEGRSSLLNRLRGTGVLDRQIAQDHGVVGVAAKASGIRSDARVDYPYAAYGRLNPEIATEQDGDVYARFTIRVKEVYSSIDLISRALRDMPGGDIQHGKAIKLKKNYYAAGITEGWRGNIVYFVATDQNGKISRVDICDPSFLNWTVLGYAARGNVVPDFPLINKSFNLSYSGNDL